MTRDAPDEDEDEHMAGQDVCNGHASGLSHVQAQALQDMALHDAVDDDEYEQETTYVVVDLGPEFKSEDISNAAKRYGGLSIIGLDQPAPFVRVGNLYFQGKLDRALGTDLIFEATYDDDDEEYRASASSPTHDKNVAKATDEDDDDADSDDNQQTPPKRAPLQPTLKAVGTSITRLVCTRVSIEKKGKIKAVAAACSPSGGKDVGIC
ncbi:hypothetical protein SeLEV6574_g00794 [Synchytrium endobioticum]|uniref:Transcription factor TFIIIC triple barrel domain-containing protein n=1 Tax=Synchytrium endobioticum TaxID=286115 RepID=A0A507DGU5_9FUNG|nr:hypothetical protein SeLEV6574_g00794 [Synchytrium endobioticum]